MSHSGIEHGWNSDLVIDDDEVIKTSLRAYDYDEAQSLAEGLAGYAADLNDQPLRTAQLRGVSVLEAEDGYHLRHTYDLVDGPSLAKGPEDQRRTNISKTLSQIAAMDTIDDHGTLAVPFDAKVSNFHADADGPALIDIFPVLTRHADGSFPLEAVNGRRGSIFEWAWGTKTGAMAAILSTGIDRGNGKFEKIKHIATEVDDWCYDALPDNLDTITRDQLRREIGMHFIPYMLRNARHQVLLKRQ